MRVARCLVPALLAVALSPAIAQTLNLKPGGWNMTYKTEGDMKDLPARIQQMPPEQRSKAEASLRNSLKPRTTNARVCLKKEDLDRFTRTPADGRCQTANVKRTSTLFEADMNCKDGRTGHMRIEAKSPDALVGRLQQVQPKEEGAGTLRMDMVGTWAGASCEGFKD